MKNPQRLKCDGVCPVHAHPNEYPSNNFTVNMVLPIEEEYKILHSKFHDEAARVELLLKLGVLIDPIRRKSMLLSKKVCFFLKYFVT